jgi:hypothetical protein
MIRSVQQATILTELVVLEPLLLNLSSMDNGSCSSVTRHAVMRLENSAEIMLMVCRIEPLSSIKQVISVSFLENIFVS